MYALTVIAHVLENETQAFLQKTMECACDTRTESGNRTNHGKGARTDSWS